MDIIEDIYEKYISLSEKSMNNDKEYVSARNKTNQYCRFLCARLPEKELTAFHKLISAYNTKIEKKSAHYFKEGFKAGLSISVNLSE